MDKKIDKALFFRLNIIEGINYQSIMKEYVVENKQLTAWYADLQKKREKIGKYRRLWSRKRTGIPFVKFYDEISKREKKCCYCGITQDNIDRLYKKKRILNEKRYTRGRQLELERKDPSEPYSNLKNLVWACYWCNNAKSDQFTYKEFKPFGKYMAKIWQKRLSK